MLRLKSEKKLTVRELESTASKIKQIRFQQFKYHKNDQQSKIIRNAKATRKTFSNQRQKENLLIGLYG